MSDARLELDAPAKINLVLEVLGRRPDGFHELATVFQTVDLCDRVELRVRDRDTSGDADAPDLTLIVDGPESPHVPATSDNLVVRAAAGVLREAGALGDVAVDIHLTKHIPAGGGLGGGSSDAATTARGVNRLLGDPLDADALHELCAGLGSDVPFFLLGGTALGRGRGERLRPVEPPLPFDVTLLLPGFAVPTPAVFAALDAQPIDGPRSLPAHWDALLHDLAGADAARLDALFRNDLSDAARHVEPRLHALLRHDGVHLSGSGSTAFTYAPAHTDEIATWGMRSMRVLHTRSRNR